MAKNFKNKGAYKKWLGYIYANDLNKPGGEDVTIGGKKHKVDRSTAKQINMNKTHAYQAKPDYIDIDGDGNKKESMKEAAASVKSPASQSRKEKRLEKKEDRLIKKYKKTAEKKEDFNDPKLKKIGDKLIKTGEKRNEAMNSPAKQKALVSINYDPNKSKSFNEGRDGGPEVTKLKQQGEKLRKEKQLKEKERLAKKEVKSPAKMNRYDKDMMHERELIYDAKKEIHNEDVAKHKSMAKQGTSFAVRFNGKSPVKKMHYGKSPAGKFEAFDQMDTYDAKQTAGMSPATKQGCQISKHMKSR